MIKFILRRIFLQTLPALFLTVTVAFFLIRLAPGGPFSSEKNVSPEVLKQLNSHYGLDKPLLIQYFDYLKNICRGDLGPSFKYPGRTVAELIAEGFPVSVELGTYALLFSLLTGILAGLLAASKPGSARDFVSMIISTSGICIPSFVLGPLLVLLFGLKLGLVNVSGWNSMSDRLLPSFTLGMVYVAYIARLTRAGLLETMVQDYIRTARAKGIPERVVMLRHALRGALLPVVSFMGPAAAGLITGSFVVETIFSIPGLGRFFITAAFNRDYTMIMGTVVFYAAVIIFFNTIVDITLAILDPRLRSRLNEKT
ncbi:MAG TPA: ABC transporter permease [Chitinispirillaceae bacterium]|jgi:oligopeptide transport system permease protein|nr:ABC transporter permease [Chitinispirillaceae bacterium]